MSYVLRIEQKPTYLHAVVTGHNTRNNVLHYLEELLRECAARDCWYVLVEERLEGPRLGTMDVFEIASQRGRPLGTRVRGIAYVDVNAAGDLMKFAEDVAVNRGIPVRMFRTVEEAGQWLVAASGAAGKPVAGKPVEPG
jgi:hypothetical protein